VVYLAALHRQERHRLKTLRSRGHRVLLAVLVESRREAGLTQRDLAGRLKLPQSYVSKIETGERRIDPVECATWARACKVEPGEFFNRFVAALGRKI
jgi:transcriptional regulator with XRE-family HTH domain